MALFDKWEVIEKQILPKQYWQNDADTLFESGADLTFTDQPFDKFTDLCYVIKLK